MNLAESLKIASFALARNKLRSFLTMLGIIIGVASVVLLMSLGAGLQESIVQQLEKLGTNTIYVTPGSFEGGIAGTRSRQTNKLKIKDAEEIRKNVHNIVAVSAGIESAVTVGYQGEERKNVIFLAVEPQFTEIGEYKLAKGRYFTKSENASGKRLAIIGQTIVDKLLKGSEPLGKEIIVKDKKYKIIGVFEKQGSTLGQDADNIVVLPLKTAQQQLNFNQPTWFLVKVNEAKNITQVKSEIKNLLLKRLSKDEFSILSQEEALGIANTILGIVTTVLAGIAAISLLVGGVGISNIMLVSVTERTKEIGLRKAVGAKPSDILIQFLIEAVVLSVTGGVIGLILASLGTLAIGIFMKATITPLAVILAFCFSAIVGIIFGVAPAIRAARLNPIDALRYE